MKVYIDHFCPEVREHLENIRRCCDRGIEKAVPWNSSYADLFNHIKNHLEQIEKVSIYD